MIVKELESVSQLKSILPAKLCPAIFAQGATAPEQAVKFFEDAGVKIKSDGIIYKFRGDFFAPLRQENNG